MIVSLGWRVPARYWVLDQGPTCTPLGRGQILGLAVRLKAYRWRIRSFLPQHVDGKQHE